MTPIKLPPLWLPAAFRDSYSKRDMQDYGRAAVEADRKRRNQSAAPLTGEDIERQYKKGVHIGSGLPMETCPCGFCKYRGRPHFAQRAKEPT